MFLYVFVCFSYVFLCVYTLRHYDKKLFDKKGRALEGKFLKVFLQRFKGASDQPPPALKKEMITCIKKFSAKPPFESKFQNRKTRKFEGLAG